jgi:hypothetical protein
MDLGLRRGVSRGYVGIRKALRARPRCAPSKAEVINGVPPARSYNAGSMCVTVCVCHCVCVCVKTVGGVCRTPSTRLARFRDSTSEWNEILLRHSDRLRGANDDNSAGIVK